MYCIYSNNRCKHKTIFSKNIHYCINHTKLLYNKYVIYIQKIYIGYKIRLKLKNIFYRLPKDLQIIIIEKINISNYKNKNQIDTIKKNLYNVIYKVNTNNTNNINNIYNIIINNNILIIYKKIILNMQHFDKSFLKYTFIFTNNLLYILNYNYLTYYNNIKTNKTINNLIYILNDYYKKYIYYELSSILCI